jgi:hypothetical protein
MDVGLAAAAVLYCTDQVLLHMYERRCPYAPDFAWRAPLINNELLLAQVGSSSALTMGWSWEAALPLWVGVLKVLGRFLNNFRPTTPNHDKTFAIFAICLSKKKTFAICRVFFVCGHLLPAYVSKHQSVLVARFGGFN